MMGEPVSVIDSHFLFAVIQRRVHEVQPSFAATLNNAILHWSHSIKCNRAQ
jgi:hypothetical protein